MTNKYFVIKNDNNYLTKLSKKKDQKWEIVLSEHLKDAKRWKTEKGVRKILYKYIFESCDGKEYIVVSKTERINEKNMDINIKKPEVISTSGNTFIDNIQKPNKFKVLISKIKQKILTDIKYYF
jgi:hypothetical protein